MIEHKTLILLGMPISDTVVYTWITMGIIIAIVLLLKLLKPNLLEHILELVIGIVDDAMDVDDLHPYIPVLGSLMIFVLVSNSISIVPGMNSPTSDINTTISLALIIVFSVHVYGARKKGLWKYLKEFASPIFMLPIELIGQLSRTLSLSLRLFGNVLSGDLIVAIVFSLVPMVLPVAAVAITGISGVLQAYVITTLAALFISSAVEINEEDQKIKEEKAAKRREKRKLRKKNRKEIANGTS
ncbi:MAG TPA: F0F1 ATP synthase subunit A [Anaerolineaceae bacterium]|nr:F0F1 ATP synthase subunit A [Anaerolineaceae bacterium]